MVSLKMNKRKCFLKNSQFFLLQAHSEFVRSDHPESVKIMEYKNYFLLITQIVLPQKWISASAQKLSSQINPYLFLF